MSPTLLRAAAAYLEPVTPQDAKKAAEDDGAAGRETTDALVRERVRQLSRPWWADQTGAGAS